MNETETIEALDKEIEKQFTKKVSKSEHLNMELMLVDILRSKLSDAHKVKYSKLCIDAFTKRGHFTNQY